MNLTVPQLGEGLDSVKIISKLVEEGQSLKKDQRYISVETDKSAVEIEVSSNGILHKWLCNEGDEVPIGGILAEFSPSEKSYPALTNNISSQSIEQKTKDSPKKMALIPPKTRRYIGQLKLDIHLIEDYFKNSNKVLLPEDIEEYLNSENASLSREKNKSIKKEPAFNVSQSSNDIFISKITAKQGSKKVKNEDLDSISDNFFLTTGIKSRNYIDKEKGESGLSLACDVAQTCLNKSLLDITDIDFLICATGTPKEITPSMANSILSNLSQSGTKNHLCGAFDINAACSGWLYGLQLAYDFLSNSPQSRVLLVTSETLSEVLDFSDSHSAPLFGDAASATLISNSNNLPRLFKLFRPSLASIPDNDCSIRVPFKDTQNDYLSIQGRKVFNIAVKGMCAHIKSYSQNNTIDLEKLDWIVSHQANDRIIHAVKNKLELESVKFLSHIKNTGNTSSTSIPLSIEQRADLFNENDLVGLVSFGGGFTIGAALLQTY